MGLVSEEEEIGGGVVGRRGDRFGGSDGTGIGGRVGGGRGEFVGIRWRWKWDSFVSNLVVSIFSLVLLLVRVLILIRLPLTVLSLTKYPHNSV